MNINNPHKLFLYLITIPILISIACNIPFIQKPVSGETEVIPISTRAVEEIIEEIDETIEEINNGKPFQLVVTEAQLTSIINYELQSYQEYKIDDLEVLLRDGQVKISGNTEQNNFILPVSIEFSLSADENGLPEYKIETATIGPFELPEMMIDQLTQLIDNAFQANILPVADEVFIESILIDDGQLIISGYTK